MVVNGREVEEKWRKKMIKARVKTEENMGFLWFSTILIQLGIICKRELVSKT